MNNPLQKFLLPASVLAFLVSFSVPALRADDAAVPTVGALSDPGAPSVASAAKGSDAAQTGLNKKGKKKHGKKKHAKKNKAAATDTTSAAPADAVIK